MCRKPFAGKCSGVVTQIVAIVIISGRHVTNKTIFTSWDAGLCQLAVVIIVRLSWVRKLRGRR